MIRHRISSGAATLLAVVLSFQSLSAAAADAEAEAMALGRAHDAASRAGRALSVCNLDDTRVLLDAADRQLSMVSAGSADPTAVAVRERVATVRDEYRHRLQLANQAQQDLTRLIERGQWRAAEIRLTAESRNGCTILLEGFRSQIETRVHRPHPGSGPATKAGSAVRTLLILGAIGGSGLFTYRILNKHGILHP